MTKPTYQDLLLALVSALSAFLVNLVIEYLISKNKLLGFQNSQETRQLAR